MLVRVVRADAEHRAGAPLAIGAMARDDAGRLAMAWLDKTALGAFTVRQVVKDGEVARESFTLKAIRPLQNQLGKFL